MPSNHPLISVVVPSYNRAHLIGATIENILAQTYSNFELIVVDDGSTDDTKSVAALYLDRIVYIKQENKGITGARNTGIRAAKGKWIALQDSDDFWEPNKLEQQVQDLNENPGLDVYFLEARLERSHLKKEVCSYKHSGFSQHLRPNGFTVINRPLHYHIQYGIAWVQTTLIRKSLLFDVGLYDEWLTLYTDYDLFCRLALKGPWGFNPEPLVKIQRVVGDNAYVSAQRTKIPAKSYRNMVYIHEKLTDNNNLTQKEQQTISRTLCNNYSALGNELNREGDIQGARKAFASALKHNLKPGAAIKLALSLFRRHRIISEFRPPLAVPLNSNRETT